MPTRHHHRGSVTDRRACTSIFAYVLRPSSRKGGPLKNIIAKIQRTGLEREVAKRARQNGSLPHLGFMADALIAVGCDGN